MCDPLTLTAVAAGVSMVGQGVSALQANANANYQAQVAEQNAGLERENQAIAQEASREEALRHYRRVAQVRGQQTAQLAASGLDVGFGSAASIASDTDALAREDASSIYQKGDAEQRGFDVRVSNYQSQADSARRAGTNALIGGAFGIANTALGGAQQYSTLQRRRNPGGG